MNWISAFEIFVMRGLPSFQLTKGRQTIMRHLVAFRRGRIVITQSRTFFLSHLSSYYELRLKRINRMLEHIAKLI